MVAVAMRDLLIPEMLGGTPDGVPAVVLTRRTVKNFTLTVSSYHGLGRAVTPV